MSVSTKRIREGLRASNDWAKMRRIVEKLTNQELAEAVELERMGRRRVNLLDILKSERRRREGKNKKQRSLRVKVIR